jgi:hypothetical protein
MGQFWPGRGRPLRPRQRAPGPLPGAARGGGPGRGLRGSRPTRALFGLGAGDRAVAYALEQLGAGTMELPPGCSVTYDLEAIDILRSLLRPVPAGQRPERPAERVGLVARLRRPHGRPLARAPAGPGPAWAAPGAARGHPDDEELQDARPPGHDRRGPAAGAMGIEELTDRFGDLARRPPTMALTGARSLKRSGSPRVSARNRPQPALGCQKLTSTTSSRAARKSNQSRSAMATKAFMSQSAIDRGVSDRLPCG